ncbi:hypothetical protein ACOSP7_027724 [Xanthoceras sorbifolium]
MCVLKTHWSNDRTVIDSIVVAYFEDNFNSLVPSPLDLSSFLDVVGHRMSDMSCRRLSGVFTVEEVRVTLFQMAPSKVPGLDGFNASFYQKFWDIVGHRVSAACLEVLNNGHSMEEINKTLIVLILKVEKAVSIRDFRSISLCNVIYKVAQVKGQSFPIVPSPSQAWQPPSLGCFKLNVDASLSLAGGVVGLGLVVHNSVGLVVAAGAARVKAGFSPLLVESDALDVINVLRERSLHCSDFGLIIADIFQHVDVANIVSFSCISRSCHKVADALAKHALLLVSDIFLFDFCPPLVELLVQDNFPE